MIHHFVILWFMISNINLVFTLSFVIELLKSLNFLTDESKKASFVMLMGDIWTPSKVRSWIPGEPTM